MMRVLIIGCGRVGAGLAKSMILRGHQVTIVDKDPLAFERLGSAFKGQKVAGIGFDRDVLIQAGIERADGLASVTSSDEANVVVARMARQIFHVPRVVARLYEPRQAEIYNRLGLLTIAPTSWGIDRIADLLQHSNLDVIVSLGSGQVDLIEIELPHLLVGRSVDELTLSGEIHVVAITRGGKTFLPTLGTTFQEGDSVHLATMSTSMDRLHKLLGN
jgi:trk system potassium uptake protein TrkA